MFEHGRCWTSHHFAGAWLSSNWEAFSKSGQMHEKYDALVPGQRGGGGEYAPQVSSLSRGHLTIVPSRSLDIRPCPFGYSICFYWALT